MEINLHSDDLGATSEVSQGILKVWRNGGLDGVSILANGEALPLVSQSLKQESQRPLRITAHLNLSEGPCLAPSTQVPLLVDQNGILKHTFGTLILSWLLKPSQRRSFLNQIKQEWKAQIEAVQKLAAPRTVSAVDGHMHIHMLPFLFPIAADLCNELGVPEIRISREPFYSGVKSDFFKFFFWINILKHFILNTCALFAIPAAKKRGLKFPHFVIGVLYTGQMSLKRIAAGVRAAKKRNAESLEVIVHVGRASSEELSRWKNKPWMGDFYQSPWRDTERQALLQKTFKENL